MDHFDNCAGFEADFGRAMIAHERRDGHMKRLPPGSFGFYGGDVPTVVGITKEVLLEVARTGEITVTRNRRPIPAVASTDIYCQISSLVTRGLVTRRNISDVERVIAITDLGRQSLAVSV